ncbi:hypothetical protein K431DRAFT_324170 [Polychaeton citri CBS 116435]|uniref:Zn(2)-C6 fungal-type domain-containing protein n=1 Tax=Polychaeton citri CBS 116435 TaxID=1314669 RepID=A0A9P4PZY0_9PEZI|nr:hypothetical protein K431DRAFT_324170 [Polychaeton citri CBS 116435]
MSADMQRTSSVVPSYRRNGKLFSCEPCRRGKLRCDHNSPICGRCTRRNKPDQCVYHPAPLTKPRLSSSGIGPQRTSAPPPERSPAHTPYPHRASEERHVGRFASPPATGGLHSRDFSFRPVNAANASHGTLNQSPVPVPVMAPTPGDDRRATSSASYASPESSSAMSFKDGRHGFLGPTSYSAVYTENDAKINALSPGEQAGDLEDTSHLPPVSPEKIQQGAELLALLRDMPIYERFMKRWFDICDGLMVPQPIHRIWIDEIWSTFGRLLAESKPEQLRWLSELVWRNTRRPFGMHGKMTAEEWAKSATGRNLRWEVVGNVLSMVGLIAANLSNWDAIFDSIRDSFIDRGTFVERMRKASEFCATFCYESEALNDLYLCFMYEELVLIECLKGDTHYAAWQRTGEMCDAVVALGLHQGNEPDADTPFFMAQLRKKIFAVVYGHDKILSTFLGRPPRLSYRYCKMEMPLDLSDKEVISEGPELEAALRSLNSKGWSTSGRINRLTWMRFWFQHSRLREDILEIALGSDEPQEVLQRAQSIRRRMDSLHDSCPDFIKIPPEQIVNQTDMQNVSSWNFARPDKPQSQLNAIYTLCIHGGFTHTEFLLQRAIVNRTRSDTKSLIPIARKLLSIVLLGQSKRDFFQNLQGDLVYILAMYGLPSAGVLAIELLKQEQTRQYTPDILPRSEVIQDLSVYISALATVHPGDGNYTICAQGRRALKRVLDQILAPSLPSIIAAPTDAPPALDDMGLDFPYSNDADFLSWLDNVEWDRNSAIEQATFHAGGQAT